MSLTAVAIALLVCAACARGMAPQQRAFVHPGIGNTLEQLLEMRTAIMSTPGPNAQKSWYGANVERSKTYTMRGPFLNISRNPNINYNQFQGDARAIGALARAWFIEQNSTWAEKALSMLRAYAKVHRYWSGAECPWLPMIGVEAIVGAEILRATYPGYTKETDDLLQWYFSVIWTKYIPAMIEVIGAMHIAVFTDSWLLFNETINALLTDGTGGIPDTLPSGQVGDTGRDCGHAALQMALFVETANLAWIQGVNLFSSYGSRIRNFMEYLSQRQLHSLNASLVPEMLLDYMEKINGARAGSFMNVSTPQRYVPEPDFLEPPTQPVSKLEFVNIGTFSASGSAKQINRNTWNLSSGGLSTAAETLRGLVYGYTEVSGDFTFSAKISSGCGQVLMMDAIVKDGRTRPVYFARMAMEPGTVWAFWGSGRDSYATVRRIFSDNATLVAPMWVKLVRRGNFVYPYFSLDSVAWSPTANVLYPASLPDKLLVGISVYTGTGVFTDVRLGSRANSRPVAPSPTAKTTVAKELLTCIFQDTGVKKTSFYKVTASGYSGAPLVFVHGFKGSRLVGADGEERWVGVSHVVGLRNTRLELPLLTTSSPAPDDGVRATGPMRAVARFFHIYDRVLDSLSALCSRTSRQFVPFAYDWRRPPAEAASRLLQTIRQMPGGRAHVVAHSMGGLVALYAIRKDPGAFASIMFAGVPFGTGGAFLADMTKGTHRDVRYLNYRANFSFPSVYSFFPVDVAPNDQNPKIDWGNADEWARRKLSVFGSDGVTPERLEHVRACISLAKEFRSVLDGPTALSDGQQLPPAVAVVGVGLQTEGLINVDDAGHPVMGTFDGDGRVASISANPPEDLHCDKVEVKAEHMTILEHPSVIPTLESLMRRAEGN
eukprot:m51a1_g3768 hypothetical protein (886) ;mRNA; r:129293-132872